MIFIYAQKLLHNYYLVHFEDQIEYNISIYIFFLLEIKITVHFYQVIKNMSLTVYVYTDPPRSGNTKLWAL